MSKGDNNTGRTSNANERLIIAALTLLQRSVTEQTQVVLNNARNHGGGPAGDDTVVRTGDQKVLDALDRVTAGVAGGTQSDERKATMIGRAVAAAMSRLQGGAKNVGTAAALPFTQLAALLGPIAVVSQIMASNASGFQVVGSAFRVLASAVAPILLPFMLLFATMLITVSDIIWAQLRPALEEFYIWIFARGVPAIVSFVEAIQEAARWVTRQYQYLRDLEAYQRNKKLNASGTGGRGDPAFDEALAARVAATKNIPLVGAREGDKSAEADAKAYRVTAGDMLAAFLNGKSSRPPEEGGTKTTGGGIAALVGKNLRETIQEFKRSVGPQASFTSFSERSRQAQLAALNASPFETKMLDRMQDVLAAIDRAAATVLGPPVPAHGDGRRDR